MPAAVSREKGFSMVEVLLAMMLLVMIVTALSVISGHWRRGSPCLISIVSSGTMPGISLSFQQLLSRQAGRSVGGRQHSLDVSASRLHLFLLWVGAVS